MMYRISTNLSSSTETGYIRRTTVTYGRHELETGAIGIPIRMVVGFKQFMAGLGFPTNSMVGQLVITADGHRILLWDGYGFRLRHGGQRGYLGGAVRFMPNGHRYLLKPMIRLLLVPMWTIAIAFPLIATAF